MDSYLLEWLSLILRWLHLITGVAWIGASFYFIWLDNSLEQPPQWKKDKGIRGDLWAVHGGGIYEVAKYQGAPEAMPARLHWFKWEAYSTWITGMLLLAVIYYLGAETYLIDPGVARLTQSQAIGLGLASLLGSWFVYTALCHSPLARHGWWLGGVLLLIAAGVAWALTSVFSGRGAYIHFGAIIGTLMVGNVFRVIMPAQRKLVAALEGGDAPDPAWGAGAKLRSTHNTYLTLPLLFIMISNHYPMTYGHPLSWAILVAIVLITALARQFFILRHRRVTRPALLVGAVTATLVLAVSMAPQPVDRAPDGADGASVVGDLGPRARSIIRQRCATCHAATPTDPLYRAAPGGIVLETQEQMERWSARIHALSVITQAMPPGNRTNMTAAEREIVGRWIEGNRTSGG